MESGNHVFLILAILSIVCISNSLNAQLLDKSWKELVNETEASWYGSEDAKRIAEQVLIYQRDVGGWPKNVQMHHQLSAEIIDELVTIKSNVQDVTIDNDATITEMLFLSKMYRIVPDKRYGEAFLNGLNYLLEAQYDNGGWPQYYPHRKGYYSHITYNDNAMINVMRVLYRIINEPHFYSIDIPQNVLSRVKLAFEKGIACILDTQYMQQGILTAWCAQHDEFTLVPAKARSYELPSLSGAESAPIVELLMAIENPSAEIKQAINSAVAWFEKVKLVGLKEERRYNDQGKIISKKMIPDPTAEALWARFMDLEDNTPFFCDRDGIKKKALSDIGDERRNGYKWYVKSPSKVLSLYPEWKSKHIE